MPSVLDSDMDTDMDMDVDEDDDFARLSYAAKGKGLALPEPIYNWFDKDNISAPIFNRQSEAESPMSSGVFAMPALPSLHTSVAKPTRPKIKRRDTPRPNTTTPHTLPHIYEPQYLG
jgi:hypothetical protein